MKKTEKVLDLINTLLNDIEEESFLVMYKNPNEESAVFAMEGESLNLQAMLSKGHLNHNGESKKTMADIKNFILNACVLLCNQDNEVRDAVINSIIDSNT